MSSTYSSIDEDENNGTSMRNQQYHNALFDKSMPITNMGRQKSGDIDPALQQITSPRNPIDLSLITQGRQIPAQDIDLILMANRSSNNDQIDQVKPVLKISDTGKFQDQFYHTQGASRTMNLIKNRQYKSENGKSKTPGGHQGGDTEQFSEAEVVYSGYLKKRGSYWKTWKRRYFILRRNVPILGYYTSRLSLTKLGEIIINQHTKISTTTDGSPYSFVVTHENRNLQLEAEKEEDMKEWIHVIKSCIEQRTIEAQEQIEILNADERQRCMTTMRTLAKSMNDNKQNTAGSISQSTNNSGDRASRSSVTRRNSPQIAPGVVKRMGTDSVLISTAAQSAQARRGRGSLNLHPVNTSIDNNSILHDKGHDADNLNPSLRFRQRSRSYNSINVSVTKQSSCNNNSINDAIMPQISTEYSAGGRSSMSSMTSLTSVKPSKTTALSLSSFNHGKTIELSVSIGTKGSQDSSKLVVCMGAVGMSNGAAFREISRTEMRDAMFVRTLNNQYFVRDFNSLLSLPLTERGMLQFEIYMITSPSSEDLQTQIKIGYIRVDPMDLLFSSESTLFYELRRTDHTNQVQFLLINRIVPNESLNLGHTYTYARSHFVADIVPSGSLSSLLPTSYLTKRSTQMIDSAKDGVNKILQSSGLQLGDPIQQFFDSTEANHLLVTEELAVSYCSISVAATYLGFVQERNSQRIQDCKIFISDMKKKNKSVIPQNTVNGQQGNMSKIARSEHAEIVNMHTDMISDAEHTLNHFTFLYEQYRPCADYYNSLLSIMEEGTEPGITSALKRSSMKKDKNSQFMPTNLNSHIVRAKRMILHTGNPAGANVEQKNVDEFVHCVTTHGCAAAHTMGFKEGGLKKLYNTRETTNSSDRQLLQRIDMREDIVRCQILAISAACFLSVIGLSSQVGLRFHRQRLEVLCSTGFLLSIESLLSTYGNEKGMLEDMFEGVKWLNSTVSFQIVNGNNENLSTTKNKLEYSKCVRIDKDQIMGGQIVVVFAVVPSVFEQLPIELQQGHAIKLRAVLFTQGINEMQSVANSVLNTSLQDQINVASVQTLQRYFQVYEATINNMRRKKILKVDFHTDERVNEISKMKTELLILSEQMSMAGKSVVKKKMVNSLIESSDLCRRLGAGRTTCCKSGKDRTAMSVTLECSRLLVDYFSVKQGVQLCTAMRERGVRRVNVKANTGKGKFAFNGIQMKCLPDCYRPPFSTVDANVAS